MWWPSTSHDHSAYGAMKGTHTAPVVDQATFRSVLGRFATGITVVTARDADGKDFGITVSALAALSLAPPLLLICIDRRARIHPVLLTASHFAVNVLSDEQEEVSRRFAAHLDDRFEGVGFTRGVTEAALLHGALAHIECALTECHPGGDHSILVGTVIAASADHRHPLLYYRGGYVQLGDGGTSHG
jgi:flavin reductase (DIM6/NTAB) family NADH-FMN oxidoreductase RutF